MLITERQPEGRSVGIEILLFSGVLSDLTEVIDHIVNVVNVLFDKISNLWQFPGKDILLIFC